MECGCRTQECPQYSGYSRAPEPASTGRFYDKLRMQLEAQDELRQLRIKCEEQEAELIKLRGQH